MIKKSSCFLELLFLALFALLLLSGCNKSSSTDVQMLSDIWNSYKQAYVQDGRTVDNGYTTSEGQSYTMLRAVWSKDKKTFDAAWNWTKNNLQHENDSLFSWHYGKRTDGSYGVTEGDGGINSASDADTSIALALIFAYDLWGNKSYLAESRGIIKEIWSKEVILIGSKPYLLANDIEKKVNKTQLLMNPSYFAPYAYKIFSKYDSAHDWNSLVQTSYDVISNASSSKLDKNSSANIPPDWISINRNTAEISGSSDAALPTTFSYDAMRVPFQLALDWMWFSDSRAKNALDKFIFIDETWMSRRKLFSVYSHDGSVLNPVQSISFYGGLLGYFIMEDSNSSAEIYSKLKSLYSPEKHSWTARLKYYDDNWAWFGMALYTGYLKNLDER